jgi:hypothetical protein
MENVYSELETNRRTNFEGHNPHLRLPGNRNIKVETDWREDESTLVAMVVAIYFN